MFVITLTYLVVLCMLFAKRWCTFPIYQRLPIAVVIETASFGIAALLVESLSIFPDLFLSTSCFWFTFVTQRLGELAICTNFYRVWWLFSKDFSTKALTKRISRSNYSEAEISEPKECGCFRIIYKILLFEWKFLPIKATPFFHVSPLIVLSIFAQVFIPIGTAQGISANSFECLESFKSVTAFGMVSVVYTVFGGYIPLIFGATNIQDNLKLAFELKALVWISLIELLYLVFIPFVTFQSWKLFESAAALIFMSILMLYPLLLSYANERSEKIDKAKKKIHNSAETLLEELKKTIETMELRNLFLKFLESEFSVENLAFYEACTDLERMIEEHKEQSTVIHHVRYIRDHFISTSALTSVNISFATRKDTLSKVNEEALSNFNGSLQAFVDVFKASKDEIFKLMARDSFGRFKRSEAYLNRTASPQLGSSGSVLMVSLDKLLGSLSSANSTQHSTNLQEPLIAR
jgi:hypothetical protein